MAAKNPMRMSRPVEAINKARARKGHLDLGSILQQSLSHDTLILDSPVSEEPRLLVESKSLMMECSGCLNLSIPILPPVCNSRRKERYHF